MIDPTKAKKLQRDRLKPCIFHELPESKQIEYLQNYKALTVRLDKYHYRRMLYSNYGLTFLDMLNLIRWKYKDMVRSAPHAHDI